MGIKVGVAKQTLGVLLFTGSMLLPAICFSQVEQPERYEIELDYYDDAFTTVSVEKYGIVLTREIREKFEKGKTPWEFIVLDSALRERYIAEIYISYGYELTGYDNLKNKAYFLFQFSPTRTEGDIIIEIDILTGLYYVYEVKRTINIQLTEFEIINNSAIFGGYFNGRPTVIQYFFEEGKTKVWPGFYFEKSRLLQVDVDDQTGLTTVISSIRSRDRKSTIAIRKFRADGEMIENYDLEPEEDTNLLDARNVSLNADADIIAGTYSNKGTKYSRGIFMAHMNRTGQQKIEYYNYGDLDNFFSYMRAKREQRVKNRIKRKKIKGKKLRFNYRLLIHNIIPYKNNYILLGEAYYPKYNSYQSYGSMYSYYPTRNNYNNMYFEGYRYTHAVVIGFDQKGNLLWDNSFEINDVTSYQLKQFVHVNTRKDDIVLLYNYENTIRSKLIRGNEVLEGKTLNDVSLRFQDDEVKSNDSEYGGLERWYDEKFYVYGIQKIKNLKDRGVKLNRRVFFINKIIYN